MKLNRFQRRGNFDFRLIKGQPLFCERVKIIKPLIERNNGIALTLFNYRKRRLASFYTVSECFSELLLGRHGDSTLIWFWRGDFGFDLFSTKAPLPEVKERLIAGKLNEEFLHIRKITNHA